MQLLVSLWRGAEGPNALAFFSGNFKLCNSSSLTAALRFYCILSFWTFPTFPCFWWFFILLVFIPCGSCKPLPPPAHTALQWPMAVTTTTAATVWRQLIAPSHFPFLRLSGTMTAVTGMYISFGKCICTYVWYMLRNGIPGS